MTSQLTSAAASLLALAGLRPLNVYSVRKIVAVVLAVSPPIVCAWVAENSANWDLFERSGSITAAIGLIVASRRYVHYGVLELLHAHKELKTDIAELLEDILTQKLGLALSGFGMIISGWGKYLGWWSFSYLLVWALFALRGARRDFIRLQNSQAGVAASERLQQRSGVKGR
jgi:hypothetical protein